MRMLEPGGRIHHDQSEARGENTGTTLPDYAARPDKPRDVIDLSPRIHDWLPHTLCRILCTLILERCVSVSRQTYAQCSSCSLFVYPRESFLLAIFSPHPSDFPCEVKPHSLHRRHGRLQNHHHRCGPRWPSHGCATEVSAQQRWLRDI